MKRVLAIAAICFATSVNADLVAQGNGAILVLHENRPCEVRALIEGAPPEFAAQVRGGYYQNGNVTIKLCWLRDGDIAIIADEHGGGGMFDLKGFKETGV